MFYYQDYKKLADVQFHIVGTNLPSKEVKYKLNPYEVIRLLDQSASRLMSKSNTKNNIVVFPETALLLPKYTNNIFDYDFEFLKESGTLNNTTTVLSGFFLRHQQKIESAAKSEKTIYKGNFINERYTLYNALLAVSEDSIQYRVKEKLVPFNEYLPYSKVLAPLSDYIYNGPFKFSKYSNRVRFDLHNFSLVPLICYESFVGHFVSKFTQQADAELIVIVSNEGWYNSEKGFVLSQKHAIARAIENRKSVLKSSNCGYSSYITPKGISELKVKGNGLTATPIINNKKTFYQMMGDYIGILALFIFLLSYSIYFVNNKNLKTK